MVAEFVDLCQAFIKRYHIQLRLILTAETVTVAEVTDDSSTADRELDENDESANRSILYTTRRRDTVLQSHCLSCINYQAMNICFDHWTLVILPVTSCSAERALSRLKIIKNRLRSTMSDEWMSDLMPMVSAAEKDFPAFHVMQPLTLLPVLVTT